MTNSIDIVDQPHEEMNVTQELLNRLNKRKQKQPLLNQFQNITVVSVDDSIGDDQLGKSLEQIKNDQTGACMTLIPYKLTSSHWIGIWILFKENDQIERAEFIDPVESSSFNPDNLQKRFAEYYPNHPLKSRTLRTSGNLDQSATLTIENLIAVVEQAQYNQSMRASASEGNLSESESDEQSSSFQIPKIWPEENKDSDSSTQRQSYSSLENQFPFDRNERNRERVLPTAVRLEEEFSITEESLVNMYKDLEIMPPCSEKSLLTLLFYISLQLVGNTITLDPSIKLPDQIVAEIAREFDYLKGRSEKEEMQSAEILKSINTSYIDAKSENWKLARDELLKVLKLIRPLDIQELFRLVERVDDAAMLMEQKEIILFLGGTGSGKSTTIHFLGGSRMIETNVRGVPHIAPTEIRNRDLHRVTTSPRSRSETRYMMPVRVNSADIGAYIEGDIILCDSPGFEDTNGPEIDIANGISIIKAIKGCKSVRPVVLFSYKGLGDRFQGLKNLIHVLVGLIPGIQDHIRCFSYLFTKYPPNERNSIHASLENIRKDMNDSERSDASFMYFVNSMLTKTKRGARAIDPIGDDPAEILQELTESNAIENPQHVFRFSITEKSKAIAQEQGRKHQLTIITAIKRFDYSLVKYKLDELKRLSQLLSHNNLEQIYHDCIRMISKHLTEEYEQGITILERCLKNETITSNEDVEQYKARVNHAELAGSLREEHLGKDVVHISAFIQFLDHQVTTVVEGLENKEMNDLAVKIALDKLEILSKFFPRIIRDYDTARQRITKKFDLVTESFRNSVHAHEFDKCAGEITKIFETSKLLQAHLDSENMQTKYEQRKSDFLQYLHDFVGKVQPILNQERLKEDDVDRLKDCFCMLESAMNTYALHPYISKKEITKIYDDFSLKIYEYFNENVKEINSLLHRKSDDLFQVSEQKFKEMSAIRTISSIQFETNREFYELFQKLVAYVRESRNYVEEKLKKFRRHEEEINYQKLAQYLFNLKYAKWIEDYQAGVYVDIMTEIEEYINQHLEKLKVSFLEINLDLDSFDKIKDADKILSEINEIKHLDRIFDSVLKHTDEVNSWFIETTKKVLDMIKDTYCSDEWQRRGYQGLDFNKIEKAFSYLCACKKVPRLSKAHSVSILNDFLQVFIQDFSVFIEKEMIICFEEIKEYQNKKDLLAKARSLSYRLREISDMREKYPQIFSCFSGKEVFKYWQDELGGYVDELTEELDTLKTTKRIETISMKTLLVKELRRVDFFLVDKKFSDLYPEYQKTFSMQTKGAETDVTDAIKKADYERILDEMKTLKCSKETGEQPLQHAQRMIRAHMEDIMVETKHQAMFGEKIEANELSSIVGNLEQIKRANSVLSEYLDMSTKIEEFTNEIIRLICSRIERYLEKIEALINSCDFFEARQEIESIIKARDILGVDRYCTKSVANQIDKLRQDEAHTVSNIICRYEKLDINEYAAHPPKEICQKIRKVCDANRLYPHALDQIMAVIAAKFRAELGKVAPKIVSDPQSIHVKRLQSALEYLPDEMRKSLENDLDYLMKETEQVILSSNKKLDDAFNTGDLRDIKSVLEEYKNSNGMQIFFHKGRELANKQMQDITSKIFENLKQDDIREALINLKKFSDYSSNLSSVMKEDSQLSLDIESRVKDTFQKAYSCVINQFFFTNISVISNEIIQTVEKSFFCIIEFMKFGDELIDQSALKKLWLGNFDQSINEFHEKFSKYIHSIQTNYETALQKLGIQSLVDTSTITLKWNSLFTKINEYENVVSHIHTHVNMLIAVLKDLPSYSAMIESISEKIKELSAELLSLELINDYTKDFRQQRNEFYYRLNEKFLILEQAKLLSSFKGMIDIQAIIQNCVLSYEGKLADICSNIENFLENFFKDFRMSVQEYDKFNSCYNNLLAFTEQIKVTYFGVGNKIKIIDDKIFSTVQSWAVSGEKSSKVEEIAVFLINMKRISNNIHSFQSRTNERIDLVLSHHKNTGKLNDKFKKLATVLNRDPEGVGQTIISEHKAFQGFSLSLFNERIRRHGIEYVLENLKADFIDKGQFRERYQKCYALYTEVVQQYLKPNVQLDKLISDTKLIFGDRKQEPSEIVWDSAIRDCIPKAIAHVFALWTLKNVSHYFEAISQSDRDNYLLQPHAAQVAAVLLMLGIADREKQLSNNLIQIGTGEGKSVTLAVTASVLALAGFDVWCACYSEQLSTRDYNAFRSLFDSLGLLDRIHYGTFHKLSEGLINENGELRQIVEQFMSRNLNIVTQNSQQIKRAKILLVDEVDVFFSREFYGNVYTPSARLSDPTITSLINFIWANRKEKLRLDRVRRTQEYQSCSSRFPNWIPLIEETVKDMLLDVKDFGSHDYVVKQDKIGYIEQDDIIFNVNYGYKTLFAYYLENERGRISKKSLEENISILIRCGSFSYGEMPREFKYVMGVTGTLETLNEMEKQIVQIDYKIRKFTILPSVFAKNNLTFIEKDDVMIENPDDYFCAIKREIIERLQGQNAAGKRAVLVFFESKKKLMEFYNSDVLASTKESVAYLTEEELAEEKEYRIRRATVSEQITLFTRTFGRGIDFGCYDQTVANNGGIHVIQTFLSEEESEEVQIKGRTARQGDKGSYSLILLDRDLEKFHIEKENIEDIRAGGRIDIGITGPNGTTTATKKYRTVNEFLKDKRLELFRIKYETNKKYVEEAAQKHREAQKFLVDLQSGNISSVRDFLVQENRGIEVEGTWSSRTICLMDATGSMSSLLNNCKATLGTMFERASAILRDNNICVNSFQLQLVVYRNYNSRREKILQTSSWETKPDNLRVFMNTIEVEGGLGNEAIEIGLWHANKEHEREAITQVIVIGDAPPNTKDEVRVRREIYEEHYWSGTDLSQATYYEDELAKLASENILVHCFYVKKSAEISFTEMAKRTGGQCAMLDVNSGQGTGMLTDFVAKEILRNVGGISKGTDLVAHYERKYPKSYA